MTTTILAILLTIAIVRATANKISVLAVLMYYTELGVEPPSNEMAKRYSLKAAKRLFHIPS